MITYIGPAGKLSVRVISVPVLGEHEGFPELVDEEFREYRVRFVDCRRQTYLDLKDVIKWLDKNGWPVLRGVVGQRLASVLPEPAMSSCVGKIQLWRLADIRAWKRHLMMETL